MKSKLVISIFIFFFTLQSCKYFKFKSISKDNEIVAKIGDEFLYKNDLKNLYHPNMSKEDSIKITDNFINNWAKNQILLQKAKINLTTKEEDEIEEMVKKYKNDLLINSYKAALVSQNIDSLINDREVINFYNENMHIFKLNEDMLKYKMISYQTNDKKAGRMKELLKKNDTISLNELMKGGYFFQSVQTNDSIWISYEDLVKKYPVVSKANKESLFLNNSAIELNDGNISYYFYIKSFLQRGQTSPLQFVKSDVRKMIIHQKKLKYLQDIENKLINEAIQNKIYEKY